MGHYSRSSLLHGAEGYLIRKIIPVVLPCAKGFAHINFYTCTNLGSRHHWSHFIAEEMKTPRGYIKLSNILNQELAEVGFKFQPSRLKALKKQLDKCCLQNYILFKDKGIWSHSKFKLYCEKIFVAYNKMY